MFEVYETISHKAAPETAADVLPALAAAHFVTQVMQASFANQGPNRQTPGDNQVDLITNMS